MAPLSGGRRRKTPFDTLTSEKESADLIAGRPERLI
jgi:hypothetical protein